VLRRIGRLIFKLLPLWSWRIGVYGSLTALVLVGGAILGLRYWILPNIDSYRDDLERALTRATGQRIDIGEISADWQGLRPQFSLGKVVVYDAAGRPALELARIDNSLSWLSLLALEPRFHTMQIHRPHLEVRRAPDGTVSIAGIALRGAQEGRGLADWVFRQRQVTITGASVEWIDEQRGAPPLELSEVTLQLQNEYFRHRFALNGVAPAEIAGQIDLRGDLVGRSLDNLAEWQGQLFVQLDYVDLAVWQQWLDVPIEIAQGRGGVRAWIDVAQERPSAITADLALVDLKARLAPDLQQLDLTRLAGRINWRGWSSGFEVSAHGLKGVAVVGHTFDSADFSLRRVYEQAKSPSRTEVKATSLDLDALAHLVEHLPIEPALRAELDRYEPRGKLYELSAKWTGMWHAGQYEVKTRFEELAFNPVEHLPGWRGVTGTMEANEKGGSLTLTSTKLRIELPKVFEEPLDFDQASGQLRWAPAPGRQIDFRLSELKLANADLAGTVSGSYRSASGQRGTIDLTAALTRADASKVAHYLPLVIGKATREWLRTSVLGGRSNDVKLKLKGNLAHFPFADAAKGVFEVTAKAREGVLEYATGWPRIEALAADLVFSGKRMEIRAASGRILEAQIARVQATIPDLLTTDEILEVSGEAEGPTAEFARFMEESPVAAMIERSTKGMAPQGNGRLALRLTMPLRRIKDTRVAGSYQLQSNRLHVHPDLPPLEQVTGRVDFTESSMKAQGIAAQLFGGPLSLSVTAQDGTVAASASGRASVEALRKSFESPLLAELSGSADWRSAIRMRGKQTDFTLESDLRGVGSGLPVPLAKTPAESTPLRLERRALGDDRDQIDVVLGNVLNARVLRRREGEALVLDRAAVGLGVEPPATESPGIAVRGALASLDLDRWRALAGRGASGGWPPVSGMALKLGTLELLGRRFHDVAIDARQQGGNWQAQVSGRELAGEIDWRAQGKGQLVARLKRLSLPPSVERAGGAPEPEAARARAEYPALDVVVEDFQHKGRSLGRLQLAAVPDGRSWQIEQLQVLSPEGTLTADGTWHWQAQVPRTQVNFKIDVSDIGKFLARMGYPEGVRGGTARLAGTLGWNGPPQDMDMPSLTGSMTVEAARGQFAKLEPGIGKLLSILSLQALPRRVALDFKDVFSEGFAFDSISGEVKVQGGLASTQGFRIDGSSAKVAMSGEVDLARETQKLRVRVVPSIGDSVATVTALLGGPVAGIGVFLAQRLLNDPLGQLIAYDYSVTGTWSDPAVVKLGTDRAEPS
jgi:uncharacterized protein (TIGR02099 family)